MNKTLNRRQKSLLVFSIILLIALSYYAIRMTSANLSFYQTFQLEKIWKKDQALNSKKQFEQALKAINHANSSHNNNPHYLITQGLIYEWGAISDLYNEAERKELLLKAKADYLASVKLRPTWPVTWATLAVLKWRLGETDQEMVDYLYQADKYGQHSPEVSRAWLDVGFHIYKSKSIYSKNILKDLRKHLELSLADNQSKVRRSTLSMIKRHNAEKLVCSWLINYTFDTRWYQKQVCKV